MLRQNKLRLGLSLTAILLALRAEAMHCWFSRPQPEIMKV
jgi:hypothetical protein